MEEKVSLRHNLPEISAEYVLIRGRERRRELRYRIKDALSEFLGLPLALLIGFFLISLIILAVERADPSFLRSVRESLSRYLFATPSSTADFLGVVAAGLITMTSIVLSMLLIMLQQAAGNMGNMIYDQFLHRRLNQFYVGFISGTVVLALIQHAAVSESFNPVLGASFVFLLVLFSVGLLIYFLYAAINQMRPENIVAAIKHQTLHARKNQLEFLNRTYREPQSQFQLANAIEVRSLTTGYISKVDLDIIADCLEGVEDRVEILIHAPLGNDVAYYDCIAEVTADDRELAHSVAECIGPAFHFAAQRNFTMDAAFGLRELEMVAWTEVSSSKHNPETGLIVIHALRDILARWLDPEDDSPKSKRLPVVCPDFTLPGALYVFQSLVVVSVESKQQQNYTAVLQALTHLLDLTPPFFLNQMEETILRILPASHEHTLVHNLDAAMLTLANRLERAGLTKTAGLFHEARRTELQQFPSFPHPSQAEADSALPGVFG